MSDFNPVTLFYILHESLGSWLWVLLALAFVLLAGIVSGFVKLRRAGRTVARPMLAAIAVGLIAAAVFTFAVPIWTLADTGALGAPVDYVIAFVLALIPGAVVASLVFMLAARRRPMPDGASFG
jgi:hypothetical protein